MVTRICIGRSGNGGKGTTFLIAHCDNRGRSAGMCFLANGLPLGVGLEIFEVELADEVGALEVESLNIGILCGIPRLDKFSASSYLFSTKVVWQKCVFNPQNRCGWIRPRRPLRQQFERPRSSHPKAPDPPRVAPAAGRPA